LTDGSWSESSSRVGNIEAFHLPYVYSYAFSYRQMDIICDQTTTGQTLAEVLLYFVILSSLYIHCELHKQSNVSVQFWSTGFVVPFSLIHESQRQDVEEAREDKNLKSENQGEF